MICRLNENCGEKCDRLCEINVGDNLARFIRGIDTVESRIGELSGDTQGDAKFITSGLQIDDTSNPAHIMTDISVSIDVSKKFKNVLGKTPMSMLNEYIKVSKASDGPELKDKLRRIESNKLLILPVKPKMHCEVLLEDDTNAKSKSVFKNTCIDIIKWVNNPKTSLIECTILTEVIDGASNKRGKISIEDYGSKIRLTDVERSLNSSEVDRNMVKMSRFGYFKPVALVDKSGNGIAIDNTYMYLLDGDNIKLIAYWDKCNFVGEELYNEVIKTTLYKKLKKNINYIWQHKRFIAPYGLAECNKIEV